MSLMRAVGAAIRARREAQGLTQERLAFMLGMAEGGRSWVCKVENGRKNVSVDVLEKIAAALGCEPAELLKGER